MLRALLTNVWCWPGWLTFGVAVRCSLFGRIDFVFAVDDPNAWHAANIKVLGTHASPHVRIVVHCALHDTIRALMLPPSFPSSLYQCFLHRSLPRSTNAFSIFPFPRSINAFLHLFTFPPFPSPLSFSFYPPSNAAKQRPLLGRSNGRA